MEQTYEWIRLAQAGDAAAERVGHCAMMASDIVDGLMDVLRKQEDTKRQ